MTGTDAGWLIDHVSVEINEYPVTSELGTNGTVRTDGYGVADANTVTILSGAWQRPGGLPPRQPDDRPLGRLGSGDLPRAGQ